MDEKKLIFNGSPHDNCCHIYYFPWLKIKNAIRINQLALLPYPSKVCDEEIGKQSWLVKKLNTIIQSCLDSHGKPVSSITLIAGPEGLVVPSHDRNLHVLFHALDMTLNILHFRYRNYNSNKYSGFRLNMHRAAIDQTTEGIYTINKAWFHETWTPIEEIQQIIPVDQISDIDFPVRRIREICQALHNSDENLRERIALALQFLKLSNYNLAQLDTKVSLELMGAAFEHLFEHPNVENPYIFAFKLEDLWNYPFRKFDYHPPPFKNKYLKQLTKMRSFRLAKPPSSQKTWLQAWFLEFFKLRNDLLFNVPVNPKEFAWNITQHLRVATEILSLTIIIMLSRDNRTRLPLKNDDEKRIRNVDAFIRFARFIWYSESYPFKSRPSWVQGDIFPNLWDSVPEETN